jgi:riboflavin kinase/FMN adenylyltransferase
MLATVSLPFEWSGLVVDGEKIGRTIGFPTANLDAIPSEENLATGVYFGSCEVKDAENASYSKTFSCITYFGPRLVFSEVKNVFETYLYDFSGNLYGKTLHFSLTHFIRPPLKLNSLEELKSQLEKDKQAGLKILQQS